ncbi:fimbrial protein [Serratia sp. PAMC26656]|uniref:fimbrial protein n=1 Tax=Serratia sp. PAMC26656 TaxID=2775909 RepID=UPI0018F75E9A|nr:fimbrial protein [Serratia sp. PAMC26656]MBJ7892685.1 type 1 fimbrial protein [Serratia sp. PAMC26656]
MKTALKILLVTGMLTNSVVAHAQTTITVTGQVVQRSCTVPTNATVDLGTLYTSDLINNNSYSNWKTFDLTLQNCQNMTTVTATYNGTAEQTDYYKNNGDASNVMIELMDANSNNQVKPGSQERATVTNGNATFNLKARAVSQGNAGAGSINTQITVTYTYA